MNLFNLRKRFSAASTASSSDISSPNPHHQHPHHQQQPPQHQTSGAFSSASCSSTAPPTDPSGIPCVDGIAAGKASALGALCRIVCAKSSAEKLGDTQLAQFLVVLHDALVERDRLMLCSLIFHSTDLFKLGLPGVEILLPNYVTAIDILLTESFKLR